LKDVTKSFVENLEGGYLSQGNLSLLAKIPKRKWNGPFSGKVVFQMLSDIDALKETTNLSELQIQDMKKFSKNLRSNYGGFASEIINLINCDRNIKDIILYLCLVEWQIPPIQGLIGFLEILKSKGLIDY